MALMVVLLVVAGAAADRLVEVLPMALVEVAIEVVVVALVEVAIEVVVVVLVEVVVVVLVEVAIEVAVVVVGDLTGLLLQIVAQLSLGKVTRSPLMDRNWAESLDQMFDALKFECHGFTNDSCNVGRMCQ